MLKWRGLEILAHKNMGGGDCCMGGQYEMGR